MSIIPGGGYRRDGGIFDPFFHELADPFEGQLSRAYGGGGGGGGAGSMMMMMGMTGTQIDWKETAEAHVFKADLPGVRKEEVKVEVEDGGVLQISGERTREQEDKSDTWHRVERSTGKFCRRFRLPDNARLDDVRAAMEYGVLTVIVPKVLDRNKRRNVKSITIN